MNKVYFAKYKQRPQEINALLKIIINFAQLIMK